MLPKAFSRFLSIVLAAVISIPLSMSGLWVEGESAAANTIPEDIDYAAKVTGGVLKVADISDATGAVLDPGTTKTIEAWFKLDSIANDGDRVILTKEKSYVLSVNNGQLYFRTGNNGDWTPYRRALFEPDSGTSKLRLYEWYHVALVLVDSNAHLYVNGYLTTLELNGSLVQSAPYYPERSINNLDFTIGSWFDRNGRFPGQIDQVRLWNSDRRAFIANDMHSWQSSDSTLPVAHWDFNGTSSATTTDRIANRIAGAPNLVTSTSSITFTDVKQESTVASGSNEGAKVVSFPRTYLNASGGWQTPAGVTTVSTLVVAGGGAGGSGYDGAGGGGGGAGGLIYNSSLAITPSSVMAVRVGQGGYPSWNRVTNGSGGLSWNGDGGNGQASALGSSEDLIAIGGGGGGASRLRDSGFTETASTNRGKNGGSGGGAGGRDGGILGGLGTEGQGNRGGQASASWNIGAGGGGAGGVGSDSNSGTGGPGLSYAITGTPQTFAAGGQARFAARGLSGSINTGNGGQGGHGNSGYTHLGGHGGAGIIVVQYDTRKVVTVELSNILISGALPASTTTTARAYVSDTTERVDVSALGKWTFVVGSETVAAGTSSTNRATITGKTQGFTTLTATFTPNDLTLYRSASAKVLVSVVTKSAASCPTPNVTGLTASSGAVTGASGECYVKFESGSGTWNNPPAAGTSLRLLLVGGGGSGGVSSYGGGGGGAGAMYGKSSFPMPSGGQINVEVGAGGLAPTPPSNSSIGPQGSNGGKSVFGSLEALGGGGGGGEDFEGSSSSGKSGGSSGGSGGNFVMSQVSPGPAPTVVSPDFYRQYSGGGIESGAKYEGGPPVAGTGGGGAGGGASRWTRILVDPQYDGNLDSTKVDPSVGLPGGGASTSNITGTSEQFASGGRGGDTSGASDAKPSTSSVLGSGGNGSSGGQTSTQYKRPAGDGSSGVVIARFPVQKSSLSLSLAQSGAPISKIGRKVTEGLLSLSAVVSPAATGTYSYSILDTSIATVSSSTTSTFVLNPLSAGTTTLGITFTPTGADANLYDPVTIFETVEITADKTIPGSPSSVLAIKKASTERTATISWLAPTSTGGSSITGYTVTANPGGETCSTATLTCDISGLTPGVSYTFGVVAVNENTPPLNLSEPAYSNQLSLLSPPPVGALCDASAAAQNGIKVEPNHGKVFYIDTGQGQEIDAGYIGYRVKSETERSDLWVEVSGFTGGVMSLANPADQAIPLGKLEANEQGTAYYLVKATGGTKVVQGHTVKVYAQKPTIGSPTPIYQCGFSFIEVAETIKAAANKVDSITSTSVSSIGSTMTITVLGDSGTIGQGNAIDGRMFALLPAARSNWPTGAARLEEVKLQLYSDAGRSNLLSEHLDYLRVNADTPHVSPNGFSTTSRQYYRATYTFRIIGAASSTVPIIPIAMISSGTQIKHTDVGSLPSSGSTLDLTAPPIQMQVLKSASTKSLVSNDGTTTLSYTVTLKNSGSNTLIVDEVIDSPESSMNFRVASAQFDGIAISDAGKIAGGKLAFSGPFEVPAGETKLLTYQMFTTTCAPGGSYDYQNIATAQVGSVIIGSSAATQSVVTVGGYCGEEEVQVEVENVPIPPEIETSSAINVTTSSATIRGVVDPNGAVGLPMQFKYSASPTFASGVVTATIDATRASAVGYGVSRDISGLTHNTTYYYYVQVETSPGVWLSGEVMTFRTVEAPAVSNPVPLPNTLAASEITSTSARIHGTVDANLALGGVEVRFDYSPVAAGNTTCSTAPTTWTATRVMQDLEANPAEDVIVSTKGDTEFNMYLEELTASTNYCFRIVAIYVSDGSNPAGYNTDATGSWKPFKTVTTMLPQVLSWSATTDRTDDTPDIVELEPGASSTVTVQANTTLAPATTTVVYTTTSPEICSVNSSTGVVTVVSSVKEGTCTIVANKAGDSGHYAAEPIYINIDVATPRVATTSVPDGEYRQNSPYSTTLQATGGDAGYTWALCPTTPGLPPGLTLSSAGVISGTPTQAGIYSFSVCVTSNGVVSDPQPLTITIAKAPLTVTASSPTVVYRGAIPTITAEYQGWRQIGDTTLDTPVVCSTSYVIGTAVNATETAKRTVCNGGFDDNYTITSFINGLVTVTPMAITVTALNATKQNVVQGNTTDVKRDPALFYSISPSLLPTENETALYSGSLTISRAQAGGALGQILTASLTTVRPGEVSGSYAINASGVGTAGPNYTVTFVAGTLTVQTTLVATELAVTAQNKEITYGATLADVLTAEVRRLDTDATVSSGITCVYKNGNTVLSSSDVLRPGSYTITVECTSSDNTFVNKTYGAFTLVVKPAPITIKALDTQKWKGTLDPRFAYQVVGSFIDAGHTTATLGRVTLTRAPGEEIGQYAITPSGASHPDYEITFVTGTLYVAQITIEVQEKDGVLTENKVTCNCEGLQPNAPTVLQIFSEPTTLATVTSSATGTCPLLANVEIPVGDGEGEVPQGNHTLQVSSTYPTSVSLSTTRPVALLPAPPAAPTNNDNEDNGNGGGGSGGGTGGGSAPAITPEVKPVPTTPRPTPSPNRPNPPTFVPGGVVPAPSPSPTSGSTGTPSDPLAKGPTGTLADPLAEPPLSVKPALPGILSPAKPGITPSFAAPQPAKSTVDFGNGIEASGSGSGGSGSLESAKRTVGQLSEEKIGGFAPGTGLRIEILGARTGARFVLADLQAIDAVALIRAMEASITTQAADFSKITRVVRGERPLIQKAWEPEVREGINEFFEAVGLQAPRALIDLDLSGVNNWVSVSAEVETYQPGSTVFLVATSTPIVLATAEVDQNGRAQLSGAMPVEILGSGEHRVRVVGIRSLEGVSVDDEGEIQLSEELMAEIQRFDLGTQSTIALSGLNPEGGYHSAIRVVPLIPVAPWWTLWFILGGLVLALGARYRRFLGTPTRRIIAATGVVASALPAVIIGWVSTVTNVVWVGILLGLVGAVASWFMPEQKQRQGSRRK